MQITVEAKGPTLERIVADTVRDLRAANRAVGRDIAKAGKQAIARGAPRMFGRKLSAKADVDAHPTGVTVTFTPAPRQAAAWAIAESGRRGGYLVTPRRRDALHFAGRFAESARPGPVAGRNAWTAAGRRLEAALTPIIDDAYEDALGA